MNEHHHSMQMATVKKEVETCLNLARNGDEKGLQRFVEEYIATHDSRDDRITPERVRGDVVVNSMCILVPELMLGFLFVWWEGTGFLSFLALFLGLEGKDVDKKWQTLANLCHLVAAATIIPSKVGVIEHERWPRTLCTSLC